MFAGIGGFRAGLTRAGGFHCVGHCEIDKYADRSYRAMHDIQPEEYFCSDAKAMKSCEIPDIDLICGGFPCQAWSVCGFRKGFDDPRGTLFFEIARIADEKKTPYLLMENVPGLLSMEKGRAFAVILGTLTRMGYGVEWMVLNSASFGVPQIRKRLFIFAYRDPRCAGKVFPVIGTRAKPLVQLIGGKQGYRVYDTDGAACTQTANGGGGGAKTGLYLVGYNRKDGVKGVRDAALTLNACDYKGINRNQTGNAVFVDLTAGHPKETELARCLTAQYGKATLSYHQAERSGVLIREATRRGYSEALPGDGIKLGYEGCDGKRGRVGHGVSHTLTATGRHGVVELTGRIRKLMPRECLRLQGYDEDQIDRLLAVMSDSQAYKQAGNSVTVNVIEAIGRRIREMDEELKRSDAA
ncbi:MAG: DNA (cytosine-5-)-methyltransferase [Oscillibacter sp.]|nr:DNA (cytosine-5-)-methyltransferase [Oscillibacter sp.]